MLRRKPIAGFFVRLGLLYALLIAPWPGLRAVYRDAVVSAGGWAFDSPAFPWRVNFVSQSEDPKNDLRVYVADRWGPARIGIYFRSRVLGYIPTVVLASLVLATPIAWARRARALFWGLFLIHGFIVVRLAVAIFYAASHPVFGESAFWQTIFARAASFFSFTAALSYIFPVIIWMAVTLRREDLSLIGTGMVKTQFDQAPQTAPSQAD